MSKDQTTEPGLSYSNLPIRVDSDLKTRLQTIADHYYEGNLSMAIRAAIKSGLPFLEGEIPSDKRKRS